VYYRTVIDAQCQYLALPTATIVEQIPDPWWISLGTLIHIVCFILVATDCLDRRKEPAATVLWIVTAWFLPLLGPLIYLAFGVDHLPDKGFRKHAADQQLLKERKSRESETLPLAYWRSVHSKIKAEPPEPCEKEMDRAMDTLLPDYPLLDGNTIEPLVDGDDLYPQLFAAIESAADHIHLQSFIIAPDKSGTKLLELLARKARAGIKVRLLYDQFGSTAAVFRGFFKPFTSVPNLSIAGWTQANILKRRFQVNLRNHRKICVIDGKTAFFGGINIHDENLSSGDSRPIRDYHFRVQGPIVQELQYSFMRDWFFITEEDPDHLLTERFFPPIDDAGTALVRLVNSGPTSEMEAIADVFFMAITSAKKQILLVTPYFVPTREILRALRTAALRGLDVRIIVPEKNNHVYAGLASRALYSDLLQSGVRIFERRPPFIHAKALVIDSTMAVVGTANFDARSLRLNYETDMIVYEDLFVNRLKEIVLSDLAQSREIDIRNWEARPRPVRLIENLCYLLMPIL